VYCVEMPGRPCFGALIPQAPETLHQNRICDESRGLIQGRPEQLVVARRAEPERVGDGLLLRPRVLHQPRSNASTCSSRTVSGSMTRTVRAGSDIGGGAA
jgi:hypothetical protein